MSRSLRNKLVRWAQRTIARGSKSFVLASRFLPRRERENAWLLYAWCRTCDDVTDGQDLGHGSFEAPGAAIDLWAMTRRAVRSEDDVPLPFAALREARRDAGLPLHYLEDHLRGFALDKQGWRPTDCMELEGYCYHVAGAVGGLMAVTLGIECHDEDTLSRASDLGIAFQLNNIARDLIEDARIGRCYLPGDWLARGGFAEQAIAEPENRAGLAKFARDLNRLARRYDASGRIGATRLPWRSRLAILVAANVYGEIGAKVVRRGIGAWDDRTATNGAEKLAGVLHAFAQLNAAPEPTTRKGLFCREAWYAANRIGSAAQLSL